MYCVSGGLDEVAILSVNLLAALMTVNGRRMESIAHLGSTPGAHAFGLTDDNHRAENRSKHTADNHWNSENCTKAGEAKHGSDNDAHGRDDHSKEQAAERTTHGRFLGLGWRILFLDLGWNLGWNFDPAKGTEAPGR